MDINITNAEEVKEVTVKDAGTSGRIYLPKEWVGRKIKVILLAS